MSLQQEWSVETAINVGKINNMTIIGGTGTYLTTSITKRKGMVVISYDATGGLAQWHLYTWDDVGLVWVDVTLPSHKHSSAADGGELFEAMVENPSLFYFNDLTPLLSRWQIQVVSGTGAAKVDDTTKPSIKLSTGTTSTGYARVAQGGIPFTYSNRIRWQGTWELSAITNVLFRFGAGIEDVNAGTNNNNKIGLEWCDSQATPNYYTLSANGSSRSLVDSTQAMLAAARHACRMIYYPASKAEYKFDSGLVFNKTSVLPAGVADSVNLVGWGVKNNNGGVANRDLHAYGTLLTGKIDPTAFPDWPT